MVPATDIIQDFYDVFNFAGERSFLERSLSYQKRGNTFASAKKISPLTDVSRFVRLTDGHKSRGMACKTWPRNRESPRLLVQSQLIARGVGMDEWGEKQRWEKRWPMDNTMSFYVLAGSRS